MPHGILSQAPDDRACQIDSYLAAVWLQPAWADRDCEKKESASTVSDMNVAAFGPTFILPLLVRVWPGFPRCQSRKQSAIRMRLTAGYRVEQGIPGVSGCNFILNRGCRPITAIRQIGTYMQII